MLLRAAFNYIPIKICHKLLCQVGSQETRRACFLPFPHFPIVPGSPFTTFRPRRFRILSTNHNRAARRPALFQCHVSRIQRSSGHISNTPSSHYFSENAAHMILQRLNFAGYMKGLITWFRPRKMRGLRTHPSGGEGYFGQCAMPDRKGCRFSISLVINPSATSRYYVKRGY
jgi:hypothetical protein